MTEFKKYKHKESGEIVKAEKDILFDSATLSRQAGYWIYTEERTDFLADTQRKICRIQSPKST